MQVNKKNTITTKRGKKEGKNQKEREHLQLSNAWEELWEETLDDADIAPELDALCVRDSKLSIFNDIFLR
jgi:hypothetical protein